MGANSADTGGLLAGSEPLGDLELGSLLGDIHLHVVEGLGEGTAGSLDDHVPVLHGAGD